MKQIYILLIALLMGLSANAEKVGTCGPNLKWHLTDDGVFNHYRKRGNEWLFIPQQSTMGRK